MRELTSHKVNELNERLKVEAVDEPGPGGASHQYRISDESIRVVDIFFQNGPIIRNPSDDDLAPGDAVGINGISNESLLAIVEDRLKGFNAGPYSCRENAIALTHVQDAMHWLHHRTRERMARGVEGTLEK